MLSNEEDVYRDLKEHGIHKDATQGDNKDYVKLLERHLFEAKRQLERAKAKIGRRDETIKRLSQTRQLPTDFKAGDLERKLEDLTNQHSVLKAKYQNQVGDLELQNMKLQEELDLLRSSHRSSQNELDSLRKRQTQTLVDFDALRIVLADQKNKAITQKGEDRMFERGRIKWEGERSRMEMRIEELKESKERSDKKREELKLEVGKLKEQAKLSSKEIKALKEEVKQSHTVLFIETQSVLKSTGIGTILPGDEIRIVEMEGNLRERLKTVEDERMVLKAVIKDIKDDQQALRNEITEFALTIGNRNLWDFVADLSEVTPTPQDVLSVTLNHINLSSSYYTQQIKTLNSANKSFTSKLSTTTSNLSTCQSALADLRREHSDLRTRYSALEKAHEPCDGVREELLATEKECMFRGQKIEGLEKDLQRMEIKSRDDAEKVKRANELVTRAKSAEQALDEEIQHLRKAYIEASQYQELYNDLQEQHEMILARETAAIEEAGWLAMHNAELVGHSNDVQKVSYVEGVRREMALVKQELATTRHLLNNANDKVQTLENEIAAYKSVDAGLDGLNLGASTRTRVVRRQPEGGQLTVSKIGRSILGPNGRH
ncbi:hypothetical protein D1P53_001772 [Cryptococcus gattii VGV]|nr:hypothetical protein D1P53_001772 [Cryptococcus gattii VGV]